MLKAKKKRFCWYLLRTNLSANQISLLSKIFPTISENVTVETFKVLPRRHQVFRAETITFSRGHYQISREFLDKSLGLSSWRNLEITKISGQKMKRKIYIRVFWEFFGFIWFFRFISILPIFEFFSLTETFSIIDLLAVLAACFASL